MNTKDDNLLKIKQIYPQLSAIYKPATIGNMHDVYIVEQGSDKFICRFTDSLTAIHNLKVSCSLSAHNIPVPKTEVFAFDGDWCETYPLIVGKTLHERLMEGLKGEKLDNIYQQLINISRKISEVPYDATFNNTAPIISKIARKIFASLNPSDKKLVHADLHAKNIVLDNEDNICAILDLDDICPESSSVADIGIMKGAKSYGYTIQKFKDFGIKCDTNKIEKQLKVFFALRKAYYAMFSDCFRKRILNIRTK